MELCSGLSAIFCVTNNYVAMPSGYKLVITRALGMHGIYCTQPSCFSAMPYIPRANYNMLVTSLSLSLFRHCLSCGQYGDSTHHSCCFVSGEEIQGFAFQLQPLSV